MNPQAKILEARKFSKASWIVFGAGISAIMVLQLVRIDIVYSNWGWNKSHFAQHYFWPFLMVAFAGCVVAPLFTRARAQQRFVASLLAGIAAFFLYEGSSLDIYLLYGA